MDFKYWDTMSKVEAGIDVDAEVHAALPKLELPPTEDELIASDTTGTSADTAETEVAENSDAVSDTANGEAAIINIQTKKDSEISTEEEVIPDSQAELSDKKQVNVFLAILKVIFVYPFVLAGLILSSILIALCIVFSIGLFVFAGGMMFGSVCVVIASFSYIMPLASATALVISLGVVLFGISILLFALSFTVAFMLIPLIATLFGKIAKGFSIH